MPALTNQKHEAFVQMVFQDEPASRAYVAAGYTAKNSNTAEAAASRLLSDVRVSARLAELRAAKAANLVATTTVTKAWVIERLVRAAEICGAERAVKLKVLPKGEKEPVEVEITKMDSAGLNRALELIGKELGMFIDRKDIRVSSLADLSRDQIQAFLQELDAAVDDNRGHATSGRTTH